MKAERELNHHQNKKKTLKNVINSQLELSSSDDMKLLLKL